MTALQELNTYLARLEARLRLFVASRGAASVAAFALALTLVLVWIGNRYQFAAGVVLPLRILLYLALAAALASLLALPLVKLNRRRLTRVIEHRVPGLQQRLLTIAERPDPANPFTEIVAEDALRIARESHADSLAPSRLLFTFLGSAALAAAILIWMIAAAPGYWGYGASLLWTGAANAGKRPLYDIAVQPGNKTVRRRSNQMITAQLAGFSARQVTLHARYGDAKWEQTPMQPQRNGNGYQFLFAGLANPVEYYVQADAMQSKHYTLGVKDLPAVERVRVALHFPPALRLTDTVQDPGGDIRAVQGTQADISVLTDKPLARGLLVLENGTKLELARGEGNWLSAHLPIAKDGSYHIAALDAGEAVRLSDDYFIEAKKDEPPSVRILRPGRDPHVSPIEEVPITVDASDDFGIEGLEFRYSVNGGPEQVVPLLKSKGAKEAQGATTLYFENLKVQPGDVVSFYATARDANTTSRTDIVFAQAEPFDFKFSQSQQTMGMGGGTGQDDDISGRQKQIIAATFNELSQGNPATLKEHARFLSDLELKLGEQSKALADRMTNRDLSSTNAQFEEFSRLMTQASSQMSDAAGELKPGKWHEALSPEQKALQSLLRADALFRDIQVAFGSGGMGSGAQRDLARLFDLELDTSKNQYETGQSPSSASDQQKAIDDAFQRLQELARRQQELAAQSSQQQPLEQRWQEEQLRREAEQLRQQMQQLAQNSQGQQANSSSSGQSSSGSSAQSSRQNARGANGSRSDAQSRQTAEAVRQAMNALQRAEEEMRRAVTDHDRTAEQRAQEQLAQAQNALNNMLHQRAGSSLGEMSQQAEQIAQAQKDVANRLKQIYGVESRGDRNGRELSSGLSSGEMPAMDDPNSPRWPYSYRRRLWEPLPPSRPASEQEKALASEKEELARQLEQLEHQMQQQEENLAATQPGAASKLRKALSEAEEKELAVRMQKNAEWIRQGYGERNLDMEDSVTAGVEQLSRELHDTEHALDAGGQNAPNPQDDKTAQALAQIRALREELERAQEQRGGQPGQQAQRGAYSPFGDGRPTLGGRDVQDAIDQLSALRAQFGPADRALIGSLNGTLGYLHNIFGTDSGVLSGRIDRDAVASLQRLEVELSRRVTQQQIQGARTGAPESAPEKYRDAVAEYFRKLSK
jgi:HEPN domain-containing protein